MSHSDHPRPWPRVQRALRPLNEGELAGLRTSVERTGYVVAPIQVLPNGRIIDGHHRWRLARELDVPCPHQIVDLPEEEAYQLAVDLNTERRQLTAEERREAIRRKLAEQPERSNVDIAREAGVSEFTVRKVAANMSMDHEVPTRRRTLRKATPEEVRQVHLLADEGMRPAEIARQIGRPPTTVSKWLRERSPLPPDELEHRRHERHLRNQAAWRRVLNLNHQALQVWRHDRVAFREAVKAEPNPLTIVDLASAIARTQAVFVQLMADLDERLDDEQRERVRAFVTASQVGP
jgi:predicted transcriptional regulator